MAEVRKVEPTQKVVNHKEHSEPYIKEEKSVNEPNNFGTMLHEEQQRLRDEEREMIKRQLEHQRDYFNNLRDVYDKNKMHL